MKLINIFKVETKNRVFGLDILRFIAIILVMLTHLIESLRPSSITKIYHHYLSFDGVSVFFVLSGFLIGNILIKDFLKNDINLRLILNFWKRRWYRTLPTYYLVMILVLLYQYLVNDIDITINDVLRRLFFIQNFYKQDDGFYKKFPESWSLAIEEWFYILIPLIIFLVVLLFKSKNINKIMSIVALIVLGGVTLYRGYCEFYLEQKINTHILIYRIDSIMYGVIGALLYTFNREIWVKIKWYSVVLSILILLLNRLYFSDIQTFSLMMDSMFILCLLPLFSQIEKNGGGEECVCIFNNSYFYDILFNVFT